jgi:hypothetical protein
MPEQPSSHQFSKYVLTTADGQVLLEIFTTRSILSTLSGLLELTDMDMTKGISGLHSPLDT